MSALVLAASASQPDIGANAVGGKYRRHAAGIGPPRGPKSQAVAACLNAGELMSIELVIASKSPPWPMIAL
jgi:hypothetical protein